MPPDCGDDERGWVSFAIGITETPMTIGSL